MAVNLVVRSRAGPQVTGKPQATKAKESGAQLACFTLRVPLFVKQINVTSYSIPENANLPRLSCSLVPRSSYHSLGTSS